MPAPGVVRCRIGVDYRTTVNVATRSGLQKGKILLQSEGAEIFFRKVTLTLRSGRDRPSLIQVRLMPARRAASRMRRAVRRTFPMREP